MRMLYCDVAKARVTRETMGRTDPVNHHGEPFECPASQLLGSTNSPECMNVHQGMRVGFNQLKEMDVQSIPRRCYSRDDGKSDVPAAYASASESMVHSFLCCRLEACKR